MITYYPVKKIIILTFLFLISNFILAQQHINDSLLSALNTTTIDTQRVNILNELYLNQSNPETAKKYVQEIIELSFKINYKKGLAWGYNAMGSILSDQGDFKGALTNHFKALEYTNLKKDEFLIAAIHNNIGNIYRYTGEPTNALSFFLKALVVFEKLNKSQAVNVCLGNIATVYRQQKNFDKALEYNFKSLSIAERIKDRGAMAACYGNIGIIYAEQKKFKEALDITLKSLAIRVDQNDTMRLASVYSNLSNMYSESGSQSLALTYQLKSLAMREAMRDKRGIAMNYNNIGNIYNEMTDYKKALAYQLKALELSKQLESRELMMNTYESMVQVNKNLKDYEKAFYYQNLLTTVKDSVLNKENSKQIAEMQTKFDVEKKDVELLKNKTQLALDKKNSSLKNMVIISVLIIALLIITLISLFYYNKRKKQELQSAAELTSQKLVYEKRMIESEENERRRIAQDLHDNMGAHTTSILAQIDHLTHTENTRIDSKLIDLRDDAENIMALLRETIWILKMKTISINNFYELIKSYADKQLQKNSRIATVYNIAITTEKQLTPTITLNLYRIIQESIQNIMKHAQATEVHISIKDVPVLCIEISDNGKGFEQNKLNRMSGLDNMQHRATEISFQLEISSTLNTNTTITIQEIN
jgi:two-component system, NarL family, sensor kinase